MQHRHPIQPNAERLTVVLKPSREETGEKHLETTQWAFHFGCDSALGQPLTFGLPESTACKGFEGGNDKNRRPWHPHTVEPSLS